MPQATAASSEHPWNAHAFGLHVTYDDARKHDASTATSNVATAGAEYAEYGKWNVVVKSARQLLCSVSRCSCIASPDDVPTADDANAASGYGWNARWYAGFHA